MRDRRRQVGVDTGGTFTDLVLPDPAAPGGWRAHKVLSTPDNPARAVLAGLAEACPGPAPRRIVHGSTVATNALLERKGVPFALVVTAGFADLLSIGRQNRPDLYDLAVRRPPDLVPEHLRFEVAGRIRHDGSEHTPLDEAQARQVARRIAESEAQSVAVCLLFSFANPLHELRLGQILAQTGLPVSLSHQVLAEFREVERAATTAVNAYVSPLMRRYLDWLGERLGPEDALSVMQSNGGSITAATAAAEPVRTILSGPAGGVAGAHALGRLAGEERLVTFDMGGTSTDVALIDREPALALAAGIGGLTVRTPMLDIHTVGAGGGSVAGVDEGGALCVGPHSAGADPGPICYGRGGTRLTVTDANLFLGRLDPAHFLGGAMALRPDLAAEPMARLAADLGLSAEALAEGILAVAEATMERAVRVISVQRGHDPRGFTLFSFGGAGGLHAARLARMLGMARVLVPPNPGVLSALGMLLADVVRDFSRTVMLPAGEAGPQALAELFAPLEAQGRTAMAKEGLDPAAVRLERALDMRYAGQSFELVVPWAPGRDPVADFSAAHERAYGHADPAAPVQVVNLRLRACGAPPRPRPEPRPLGSATPPAAARLGRRRMVLEGESVDAPLMQREALEPGNRFAGPALLVEYSSTLLVPAGAEARVDGWGNLILELAP